MPNRSLQRCIRIACHRFQSPPVKPAVLVKGLLLAALAAPAQIALGDDPFAELEAATSNGTGQSTNSPSARQSADGDDEFQAYLKSHRAEFDDYKKKLLEEFSAYKQIAQEETRKYEAAIGKVWDEPEMSSKKVWVDYSQDLKQRSAVDFEKRTITLSKVVDSGSGSEPSNGSNQSPKQGQSNEGAASGSSNGSGKPADAQTTDWLRKLITRDQAEAFADDTVAQAIETRSKSELTLLETAEVKPKPILLPLVSEKEKPDTAEVDAIVEKLAAGQKRSEKKNSKGQTVVTVEIPLPEDVAPEPAETTKAKPEESQAETSAKQEASPRKEAPPVRTMADTRANNLPKAARQVAGDVSRYAESSKMDTALVYAIIETESAFNPMAKSPIPAYGLMQIVPNSAGIDATEQLFGKGRVLAPSYLYTQEKNIEIGATYLNILYYRYLRGVKDPLSRLYCSIAAYNTGAGNVSRAFIGTTRIGKAFSEINAMSPDQVYEHLLKNLPYEETQHYLERVVRRMDKYRV